MRLLLLLAALLLTAAPALAQDPGAAPIVGDVNLEEGFMPDPYDVDLVAGGSLTPDVSGCEFGSVSDSPDVDLYYATSGSSDLYIYAVSGSDTTILVNTADGSWVCDDDSYGDGDPLVVIPGADSGTYSIWVGTYGGGTSDATLSISEIDPR